MLSKITVVPMIVCLLHGCRLEVMCNLVQIIWDANVPVAWKGASESKTVSPDEENLQSLTQHCTESLSTSAVLNCKLYKAPYRTSRLYKRVAWVMCSLIQQPWNRFHTPSYRGHKLLVLLFYFIFLTILYRKINTTTEWRSLWKCDIFSAVDFLMQVPVSSLHYTFPFAFYLNRECSSITIKVLPHSNHHRDSGGNNFRMCHISKDII